MTNRPTDVYNHLLKLGSQPALIWYGPDERIELSGKVLANHIAKIANFLIDEFFLEPGEPLIIDLPVHWKSIAWSLGALTAGARLWEDDQGRVITNKPASWEREFGDVVAVAMGSLALRWNGDLPDGIEDGSAAVLSHPDSLMSSADDASNYADFSSPANPSSDVVALKAQTLKLTLSSMYSLLGSKRIVLIDDAELDRVIRNEGATLIEQ